MWFHIISMEEVTRLVEQKHIKLQYTLNFNNYNIISEHKNKIESGSVDIVNDESDGDFISDLIKKVKPN